MCMCVCAPTTVFVFTGNIKLRGDSVKQQQAGRPRQSTAKFQPRNDGTEHFFVTVLINTSDNEICIINVCLVIHDSQGVD